MKSKTTDVTEQLREELAKLTEPADIEGFAKKLSYVEFLAILDIIHSQPESQKKLSSILVGLPYPVFSEALPHFSQQDQLLLQKEGATEPLQHHLSQFSHEKNHILIHSITVFDQLEQEIHQINLETAGRHDVDVLWNKLENLSVTIDNNLNEINKALALAWNTNRLDIIDGLSSAKESMERLKIFNVGHDQAMDRKPTGLFLQLETHLNSVYGNNGLREEEPAIEALSKLSIWYLKDYWELGLIPKIKSAKKLELDSRLHSEQECADYRLKLFGEAQKSLENIGLSNLRDLKNAYIFSKKTLIEFIEGTKGTKGTEGDNCRSP